ATGKTVNVSNIALTGTDAANYNLQNTTATATADITKKGLTVTTADINRRPVTISADAKEKNAGSIDPVLTYQAERASNGRGLLEGEAVAGELTRTSGESVGVYQIQQGTLTNAANQNYDVAFNAADLTIKGVLSPKVPSEEIPPAIPTPEPPVTQPGGDVIQPPAIPGIDIPTGDIPTGGTPTGDSPIGGTPAGGTPTGGTPTGDSPTGGTPAGDSPTGDSPTGDSPTGGTPTGDTPTGGTPTGGTPTGGTPAGGTPTGGTPTGGTPTGGTPTGGTPTGDSPTGDSPTGGAPAGDSPTGDSPTGGTPTGDTPTGGTPTGDTPTGDTPTGGTPTGDSPTGDSPTGGTPTGDTPTGGTPTGGTPTGDTPAGGTPTGGTPAGSTPTGGTPTRPNFGTAPKTSEIPSVPAIRETVAINTGSPVEGFSGGSNTSSLTFTGENSILSKGVTLSGGFTDAKLLSVEQTVTNGFIYPIPENTFSHSNPKAVFVLEAVMIDGSPLPTWMSFDPVRKVISGTPPSSANNEYEVLIIARDQFGGEAKTILKVKTGKR
ncbi:MAG TPA: hypothetical protein HPP94_17110, partial [Desulfuromonadales bacterium]|nr:hypothetical protein [Desulfuromonadales bacterium]